MGRDVLGGFEHQVLLAVVQLGDEGVYTVPLVELLTEATGKAPVPAAVFTTLRRLEGRGLLRSEVEPSERGGRPRRVFRPTAAALDELRRSRETLERLWRDLPIFGEAEA